MLSNQSDVTESVSAHVRYLDNDKDLAVYRASVAGGELVEHEGNYVDVLVPIENARLAEKKFDLHVEGFRLIKQITQVQDFYDDEQLHRYEDEVRAAVLTETGGTDLLIFDHTRRSSSSSIRKKQQIREAASVIHNDYSAESGFGRLDDFLNAEQVKNANEYRNRDFAIINIWRSINGTIANFPLAMCYSGSVAAEQLVPVMREGKERTGEIQLALHADSHRWCYFPAMSISEALIFKTFDSRDDGRARFTIHTSFDDPSAPDDAPPRESIESRCFVFF